MEIDQLREMLADAGNVSAAELEKLKSEISSRKESKESVAEEVKQFDYLDSAKSCGLNAMRTLYCVIIRMVPN